jgi:hydroxymethylbilane synthase
VQPLASAANHVRGLSIQRLPRQIDFAVIKTSGDTIQTALREFGGKGLFLGVDESLLGGRIDPPALDERFADRALRDRHRRYTAEAMLRRPVARTANQAARLAPCSVHLARSRHNPAVSSDLEVIDFRGTWTRGLEADEERLPCRVAGLDRLGWSSHVTEILSTDRMLPAVAQGAIGVAMRESDERVAALLAPLNDITTATAVDCERSFLKVLDGSCRTPIAGLAEIEDDLLRFRGLVLTPDGKTWHEVDVSGDPADAARIGIDAGKDLLASAGPDFLTGFRAG